MMVNSDKQKPIVDSFGRVHDSLRISVTDRCNIRCVYCMPEMVRFLPHDNLLTYEEYARVARLCARWGVTKIRLTGGEPLVRADVWKLVEMLVDIPEIQDVAMTTNGMLLEKHAQQLKMAGLNRLNISIDTVNEEVFQQLTRRNGLQKVFAGIEAAKQAGFKKMRLNAVSIKGLTESEIIPLADFARQNELQLRFIEFMPLDGEEDWDLSQVLTGAHVRQIIEAHWGPLELAPRHDLQQPAVDFQYADGQGVVGFIDSVSAPFCQSCNRMRLTSEGRLRNCLFSTVEWDLRELLRSQADDDEIEAVFRECVYAKKAGHGIDTDSFQRPEKSMYQIGG